MNSRLKVAFILPNFNAGGAERVIITIANSLNRQKFEPLIIAFNDSGPLKSLVASDVKIISLGASKIRYGALHLLKALHHEKPDVALSTMVHLNFMVLTMRPLMGGIPLIVREAITPDYFSDSILKRNILKTGYNLLYRGASRIVSPSRKIFEQMPASICNQEGRCIRIFNPVNTQLMQQGCHSLNKKVFADAGQKLFVAAGRLVHQKGFDRLIENLQAWQSRDDWRLIILGEGPEHEMLQGMISERKLHQVKLMGFVEKPWEYYALADAFLLPSRHEGLPNVALEALSMGAPVIAMNSAGGIAEIADEAQRNDVKIASSMEEFISFMDEASIQGDMRTDKLPACFSLQTITKTYEDLIMSAAMTP